MHSGRGGLNDGGLRRREGSTDDGDRGTNYGERVGAGGRGLSLYNGRVEKKVTETTGWTRSISPRLNIVDLALEALPAITDRLKDHCEER